MTTFEITSKLTTMYGLRGMGDRFMADAGGDPMMRRIVRDWVASADAIEREVEPYTAEIVFE